MILSALMKQRNIDIKTYFLNVFPQPRCDKNIITVKNLLDCSIHSTCGLIRSSLVTEYMNLNLP